MAEPAARTLDGPLTADPRRRAGLASDEDRENPNAHFGAHVCPSSSPHSPKARPYSGDYYRGCSPCTAEPSSSRTHQRQDCVNWIVQQMNSQQRRRSARRRGGPPERIRPSAPVRPHHGLLDLQGGIAHQTHIGWIVGQPSSVLYAGRDHKYGGKSLVFGWSPLRRCHIVQRTDLGF
jgi:hypothetical protein